MSRRVLTVAAFLMLLVQLALPVVAYAASVVGPAAATKLLLYNASNIDATVLVVIQTPGPGAQVGCPTDIRNVKWVDLSTTTGPQPLTVFTNTSTGWFLLKRGHTAQLFGAAVNPQTGQPSYCLQSFNIGFQGQSAACPLVSMPFPNTKTGPQFNQDISKYTPQPAITLPPNGVNGFEGSINLTGLTSGGTVFAQAPESIDITCLGGANSKMTAQIIPPVGGPYWTYNAGPKGGGTITYKSTTTMANSWVHIVNNAPTQGCDDNCVDPRTGLARPGVFPYGCSICNAFPDPGPACGVKGPLPAQQNYSSQFCAAKNYMPSPNPGNNGCQFNRGPATGAGQKFGGTIKVIYYGPLAPPPKCP